MELQKVLQVLKRFAPLEFAETWDNVGLLLEPSKTFVKRVFLTNDLTEKVMDEAISSEANMVISYHPPIFTGFKRLDQSHWKSRIVIRCLENQIALYSPHTSWDNVSGGVNDWLCKAFASRPHKIDFIKPLGTIDGMVGGTGRIVKLDEPMDIKEAVQLVKTHLQLDAVRISSPTAEKSVESIGVCAGSGSSVFKMASPDQRLDLLLTGEMSHHDVLEATHQGSCVILCEHSNTERGFLHEFKEILKREAPELEVVISESDEDPLKVDTLRDIS